MLPEIKQGHNRKVKLAAFKFRNSTTFWGIPKCNIGTTIWDGIFLFWGGGGGGGRESENSQKKLTIKSDNVINKRHTVPI